MGKPVAVRQNHTNGGLDRAEKRVVAAGVSKNVAFVLFLFLGEVELNVSHCQEVALQGRCGVEFVVVKVDMNLIEAEDGVLMVGGTCIFRWAY